MQPENVPAEEGRPEPEPATDPARRRRRTVLGTLFGLAVLAVIAVTAILLNTGTPPAENNAAAEASSGAPEPASGAPLSAPASPSASVSAPVSSSAGPSAHVSKSGSAATTSLAGWPGAGNTGTPRGVTLKSCPLTLSRTRTYDKCKFSGGVEVKANNVKITRSLILGQVDASGDGQHGLVISDTTINCGCLADDTHAPAAVSDSNYTLLRVNIFNSGHGVAVHDNVVIQDSWIHGQGANTDAHKDGVYAGDGTNVTLRHNNIECNDGSHAGCTAAIGLLNDFGPITNWVIDGNLLNTNGAYCLYGGGGTSKSYTASHIVFTNNRFGRLDNQKCGAYGPVTYFDTGAPGNVWRNNVWADNGQQVAAEN
jgi:hypothetical protein